MCEDVWNSGDSSVDVNRPPRDLLDSSDTLGIRGRDGLTNERLDGSSETESRPGITDGVHGDGDVVAAGGGAMREGADGIFTVAAVILDCAGVWRMIFMASLSPAQHEAAFAIDDFSKGSHSAVQSLRKSALASGTGAVGFTG